jgi:hypothetical protein
MSDHTASGRRFQRPSFHAFLQQARDQCFDSLLPRAQVEAALARHDVRFRERLYTPLLTLWTFLYQVLSPDPSCRAAVCRLLAWLCASQQEQASAKTDPYCKARRRLPEALCRDLFVHSGADLQQRYPATRLLRGRPILIVDGTTLSMPDTPENQQKYPQPSHHQPGAGFPILRLVGLISLSCGAVLQVAFGPWWGKQTGETALLRQILGTLGTGMVLLGDGIYSSYWLVAQLRDRGADLVARHDGKRKVNWRRGKRLGKQDHVVSWSKPPRPRWMSLQQYQQIPDTLPVRECFVQVQKRGFRTRGMIVISTLLEVQAYPQAELALAYRARWHAELDLRSIKQAMQMEVLRCKSPEMVHKELYLHLLAYNLVRRLMAEAAVQAGVAPREISFTGTLQTLREFSPLGWGCSPTRWQQVYRVILQAIATHRVNDRPDRIEPRAVKRRPKPMVYLNEPRAQGRARLLQGG